MTSVVVSQPSVTTVVDQNQNTATVVTGYPLLALGTFPASSVSVVPTGGISATDAQSALAGLDTAKQNAAANLSALAGLTGAADLVPYFTGLGAMATAALTAFGRSLIACATAGAALAALGTDAAGTARPPTAHNQAWSTITSTPTSLAGYGIVDAIALLGAANTFTAAQTIAVASSLQGLVVNYNTSAAAPAPVITGGMQIVGADGTSPFLEIDMFGSGNGGFLCKKARGTNLAKTATANGDILLQFQSRGYDGSAYAVNEAAGIRIITAEATTSTAQGGAVSLVATRVGTIIVDPIASFYSQATGIPTMYLGSSANPCGLTRTAGNALTIFTNVLSAAAITIDTSQLVGLSVAPTAGNGLLQLLSGTTKANGIAFGTDTYIFRAGASQIRQWADTGATLDVSYSLGITGSSAAQFGYNLSGSTNALGVVNSAFYLATGAGSLSSIVAATHGVTALTIDSSQNCLFSGAATANAPIQATATATLAASPADAYLSGMILTPTYNGAFTVTRHNYIQCSQPGGAATITDACVFRFDAAAGTHKAVDGATTKTTPTAVNGWVKVNVAGTIYYIPAYTSKTT